MGERERLYEHPRILHGELTHTCSGDTNTNSRSRMFSLVLSVAVLICGASAAGEDKACFDNAYGGFTVKNNTNGSIFDIRIEHSGSFFNVDDWFDNGKVYKLTAGEVFKYNTTAKAMSEICGVIDGLNGDWGKGTMDKIGDIPRFLFAAFDGENLMLAMRKMNVTVTKDNATSAWDKCFTMKQTADPAMNVVKITYVDWDTEAVTEGLPDIWSPTDNLMVSSAPATIISIATLSALITTRLLL